MPILTSVSDVINALPNRVVSYEEFNEKLKELGFEIPESLLDDNIKPTFYFYGSGYNDRFEYKHIPTVFVKGTNVDAFSDEALKYGITFDNRNDYLNYTLDLFFYKDSNVFSA